MNKVTYVRPFAGIFSPVLQSLCPHNSLITSKNLLDD